MSRNEAIELRQVALAEPGTVHITSDGHTMIVSFDGTNVFAYRGPDFSSMTIDEINEFIARMDR